MTLAVQLVIHKNRENWMQSLCLFVSQFGTFYGVVAMDATNFITLLLIGLSSKQTGIIGNHLYVKNNCQL